MDSLPPRIICIGLANVDVIADVGEDFLTSHNLAKGASNFLDACAIGSIVGKLGTPSCHPGGCAANTACGIADFGIPVQFIGKVGDDGYADIFRAGFSKRPIQFDTAFCPHKLTSTCLTLVTPDKQRSFAFCMDSAGWRIGPDDLPDRVDNASIYIEANTGLMPIGGGRTLLEEAAARYGDVPLILNLNDRAVVQRCRAIIGSLMARAQQTCFIGNLTEIETLFQTDDFDDLRARIDATGKVFAITRGADGACILKDGTISHVPSEAMRQGQIVNTVGAGDQFAAGFIAGLVRGQDPESAGGQGIKAAGFVLQQLEARPKLRRLG